MADKKLLGLNNGRPGTIGTADKAIIEGSLQVDADLNVGGDIVSRGSTNVVVNDEFLDLANGQGTSPLAAGYTAQVSQFNATSYFISSVASNVITLTADDDATAARRTFLSTLVVVSSAGAAGNTVTGQFNGGSQIFSAVNTGAGVNQFDVQDGSGNPLSTSQVATNLAASIDGNTNFRAYATGSTVFIQLTADGGGGTFTVANSAGTILDATGTFGTTPQIAGNTVIAISGSSDASNNGLFSVAASGGTGANQITINTVTVNEAPFLQTALDDYTETGTARINFVELYVQAVSDGVNIQKSDGNAIPKGSLADAFVSNPKNNSFDNAYSEIGIGDVTLQNAYENGNAIVTDGTNGDFSVTGAKSVQLISTEDVAQAIEIGATSGTSQTITIVNTAGTSNQAIDIQANGTGAGVRVRGGSGSAGTGESINIHAQGTSSVSNGGTTNQTAALQIRSENGGASILAAKEISITQVADLSAVTTLTVGAFTPDGANPASVNTVNVRGDRVTNTVPFIANEAIADGNRALAVQAGSSIALFTYGAGSNTLPTNGSTTTINNATITAAAGGVITITYDAATDPGVSALSGQALTIGTQGLASDAAGMTSIVNNVATILNALAGLTVTTDAVTNVFIKEEQNTSADDFTVVSNAGAGTTSLTAVTQNFGYAAVVNADADLTGLGSTIGFAGIQFNNTPASIGDVVDTAISGVHSVRCVDAGALIGQTLYVDESTSGAVTITAPTVSTQTVFQVGTCLSAVSSGVCLVLLQPQFIAEIA